MTAGLLDTSVVIDWQDPAVVRALPNQVVTSTVAAAELVAGPLLAATADEAARRQLRLQEVEATLEPLPLDAAVVRRCGLVVAAVVRGGT